METVYLLYREMDGPLGRFMVIGGVCRTLAYADRYAEVIWPDVEPGDVQIREMLVMD